MRIATTADAELITGLLKAFFSHEGREVAHLVAGRTPQVDLAPFSPSRFRS